MARKTQQDAVLEWLQTGAGITSFEAFKELGATRLSAIIFSLREKGYDIKTDSVQTKNRFGQTVSFARYTLQNSHPTYEENVL